MNGISANERSLNRSTPILQNKNPTTHRLGIEMVINLYDMCKNPKMNF